MHAVWIGWGVALALVLIALGLQVNYARDIWQCSQSDLLVLCSGPLADWLMPATVALGLILVGAGTWRLTTSPAYAN